MLYATYVKQGLMNAKPTCPELVEGLDFFLTPSKIVQKRSKVIKKRAKTLKNAQFCSFFILLLNPSGIMF